MTDYPRSGKWLISCKAWGTEEEKAWLEEEETWLEGLQKGMAL
jgi:hypothetical protein